MFEIVQSADGTKIAYERTGAGPSLIIAGGAFNTRHSPGDLVPRLAPHFSVYAFDRRGRGDSTDAAPYAVEREIEDIEALIEVAGGSALLYGHSSGAVLALEAAAAGARVTRLAVYEPPYMVDDSREKPPADLAARVQSALDAGQPGQAAERFLQEAVGLPAEVVAMIKQSPDWLGMCGVAHTLPYELALVGDASLPADRLAKIAVPTLALDGGTSPAWARNGVSAVAAAIPGAERRTVEGQDHNVAAGALAPSLIDFFS